MKATVYRFFLIISLFAIQIAPGKTFDNEPKQLSGNATIKIRGVINSVTLPVPDSLEMASTQNGYFLFTPCEYTIEGTDENGAPIKASNQKMFHLVLSEDQIGKIDKMQGKPVELTGSMMAAHTRYHRTEFLFQITNIKQIDIKK